MLFILLETQTYYIPIILLYWSTWSDVLFVSIVVIRIRNRIDSFRFSSLCEGVCVFCCNNRISPYFCLIFLSLLTKRPCFYVACSTKDADMTTDIIAKYIDYYSEILFNSLWRAYSLIQPLEMILRCPVWYGYFQTQQHFLLFYLQTPWHCFLLQWPFSFCLEIYILISWLISKQTHI